MFIKEKDRLDSTKLNIEQQLESIQNDIAQYDDNNQKRKKENVQSTNEVISFEKNIENNVSYFFIYLEK